MGAFRDDDNGSASGSTYLFKRTGTSWVQEAKLLPSDGAANDAFGISISISGDYAVVGARWDDDNGGASGSAYLFKRTGTIWAQEAKLLPSDGATGDWFGHSVSISGDYAVVGAWGDDDNGTNSGSAYLYNGFTLPGVLSVSIPESFGDPGDTLWVPINVSNTDGLGIISSEFKLSYDTSFAAILDVDFQQTMPDSAGWMIEYNAQPGSLWVAMSGDVPIDGAGALSYVQFALSEDASVGSGTQLILWPFLFNEGNPTARVINGSITVGVPAMSLSTDSILFDSVPAGSTETIIMNVTNVGQAELIITEFNWSLPVFDVKFSNLNASPGASIDVSISFSPTANQTYTDTLEIHSNAGFGYVILEGRGVIVGIKDDFSAVPSEWTLEQNHPNPFNPVTEISYNVQAATIVTLNVYDILGREVATLVDEVQQPGEYSVMFDAFSLPSGIYFYRLKTGEYSNTKKMLLLK